MQHFNLLTPVVRSTKTRILQNHSGGLFSSLGHLKNLGASIFKNQPLGQFERVPIFWSFDGRLNTSPQSNILPSRMPFGGHCQGSRGTWLNVNQWTQ